jgi:hypothetical protein
MMTMWILGTETETEKRAKNKDRDRAPYQISNCVCS